MSGGGVPDDDGALVVRGQKQVLLEVGPRHAADLGRAGHLDVGVVDVDHVLDDSVVLVDLDPLRHARDGEELVVLVELDRGDDAGVVEQVGRVVEVRLR